MFWIPIGLDKENMERMTKSILYDGYSKEGTAIYSLTKYAWFLDNIFGTNLVNQLACDYGEFIQKPKRTFGTRVENYLRFDTWGDARRYNARDIAVQSELFKNLLKSYNSISRECKKTEADFIKIEETNRRAFYEKSRFREGIRQITDGQSSSVIQEEGLQPKTKVRPKRIGIGEQKPEANPQRIDEEEQK